MKTATQWLQKNALILVLIQAIVATLGSLYLSDIKGYAPCVLCWYQRICMYSLIPILFVGMFRGDKKVYHYVFPLAIIGWLFALYHNLLYSGIIDPGESCSYGISCTTKYVEYFGFITIPLMSFTAFSIVLLGCVVYREWLQKNSAK
ncbi:MAG: disulfide bond formation protein B [Patescibacteria group bacterium]